MTIHNQNTTSIPGQRFAQIEDKIMLAQILRRFKVDSKVPIDELQLQFEIVLRPAQGIQIKFTPRVWPE